MDEFIQFVPVAEDDSYPVFRASEPLWSNGREAAWTVCHQTHTIRISPRAADEELAIIFARLYARQTYPGQRVG